MPSCFVLCAKFCCVLCARKLNYSLYGSLFARSTVVDDSFEDTFHSILRLASPPRHDYQEFLLPFHSFIHSFIHLFTNDRKLPVTMNFSSERFRNIPASRPLENEEDRISSVRPGQTAALGTAPAAAAPHTDECLKASTGLEDCVESLKIGTIGAKNIPIQATTEKHNEATRTAILPDDLYRTGFSHRHRHQRKNISFCKTVTILEVPSRLLMSGDGRCKCFYDSEDIERFNRDAKRTIKKVRRGNGGELNADLYTVRGLEHLVSKDIFVKFCTEKELNTHLVLQAQSSGQPANVIAEIGSRTSQDAVKRARCKALQDQADAFMYYMYRQTE